MTAEAARQESHWKNFYESAWDLRKKFIQDRIEQGETNPLRIIHQLEHHERYYQTLKIPNEQEAKFVPLSRVEPKELGNLTFDEKGECAIRSYHLLPTGLPVVEKCVFNDQYHIQSPYSQINKMGFIVDYIRDKKFDAVVELGSGFSQNLFKLYYEGGPNVPYFGGEYTRSGTECAQILAGLMPELSLTNFIYDFNHPSYEAIGQFENILVFTCHTIEQVELLSDRTLPSIAALAKNVHCIHFEPFGYQLPQGSEVDRVHQAEFNGRRWNANLLRRLLASHKNKEINLSFIGKNIMGSFASGTNPTSLAVWTNQFA